MLLLMVLACLAACHKDKEMDVKEAVVSNEEMTVTETQARFSWQVDFAGQFQTGVEVSQSENMADLRRVEASKQEDKFVAVVDSLTEGTNYYYRFVVWNKFGSTEQSVGNFKTKETPPTPGQDTTYYDITVSVNLLEGGTATGGGRFAEGDTCRVMATVNAGYNFVNWTENESQVSTDSVYVFAVIGNCDLVANFTSQEYTITAIAEPEEGGTVSGGGDDFHYGDECSLTATAASGYRFVNWTKDDAVVHGEPTYSFPVRESGEYVAHFEEIAFDLVVSAQPTVIAQGGSSQLKAEASGGTGSFSYSWTPNASLNDASIHNPIASPTITTTYTCTVTSGGQTGSGSCTVKVVCPPTDLTATVQNTNNVHLNWSEANPADSYNVYRNDTLIGQGVTNTNYDDNGLGSGTYHYRVTAVYQGVGSPKSNEASATIYASLSVTASAYPVTIPEGGSSTLTAAASSGDGNYTYNWTPSTGLNNTHIQSPTATPSSTTTYTVTVESNGETASDAVTVNVVKAPTGLAATVNGNNVHLTWNHANPHTSYKVYRDNTMIAQNITATSYNDNNLNWGTTYNYQVSTVYLGVESPKSNTAQAVIPSQVPTGAINGKFTINSSGAKVYFSQGNLQYIGSSSTPWKFADHQWEVIGSSQGNTSQTTTRDLFGWGTSGWDGSGATYYRPWDTDNSNGSLYGPPGQYDLTGTYANADWGEQNPISNGGGQAGQWRTLTKDEWVYVFQGRSGASSKYGHGKVNGRNGMILLPDEWTLPSGLSFTEGNSSWANFYTTEQWEQMEQNGAVFLPAAGTRGGTSVGNVGGGGVYWSASYKSGAGDVAYDVFFYDSVLLPQYYDYRYLGRSVRLVRSAQ